MMQVLNRLFQKQILETLANAYPEPLGQEAIFNLALNPELSITQETLLNAYRINTAYLSELGLVGNCSSKNSSFASHMITAKGIDFISDDGGLSAILGVVTVKLHAESIRDLLALKIDETNLSAEQKSTFKQKLSTLTGEILKEAINELVRKGIDQTPNLISWIENLLTRT